MINLFREGFEYDDKLRADMLDIERKMKNIEYIKSVNGGSVKELKNILLHAVQNTKFYSSFNPDAGFTTFPVMNKILLNKFYDDILVHSYDNVQTHKMHTSGSTGIPFTVVQDLEKRRRHIADLKYFGAMAGHLDYDPMCYLRAKPTATAAEQERDNIWQLDICNLNSTNLISYFNIMIAKKCSTLIAYPSTLDTAVNFWIKHFDNNSCIRNIISTSETLTEDIRYKLKAFFGNNVNIFARYSNTENGILGQESPAFPNQSYLLNWASYFFEILKLDSDEPAIGNELGRVVVTDLYNKAFPMIRYDTGDVARMKIDSLNDLPYFTELFGRKMDLIYDTIGEVVSPFLLCRTMRLSKKIEQWQFIQESECIYTIKITSNIKSKPSLNTEIESFKKILGDKAVINVEYVENIPVLNSLKRKLIINNLRT